MESVLKRKLEEITVISTCTSGLVYLFYLIILCEFNVEATVGVPFDWITISIRDRKRIRLAILANSTHHIHPILVEVFDVTLVKVNNVEFNDSVVFVGTFWALPYSAYLELEPK
jgi:hypothetical protein